MKSKRKSGKVLSKLSKYLLSMLVWLLVPVVAIGASYNYRPLPDMVPAYSNDDAAAKEVKPVQKPAVKKRSKYKRKKRRYTNQKIVLPFSQNIRMIKGETRVMKEPNAGRLAVGNGKVISAAVLDEKEILVIANKVGISSLHIWTQNGRNRRIKVTVVPNETKRVSQEIAMFLKSIPHAKASIIGDKVVVEGDNMSNADLEKIEVLAKRYPQIINFTNKVGWEKMIAMDVRVVEFPSQYLREVGIKWGATGGGAVGAFGQLGGRGTPPPGGLQINQVSRQDAQAPISGQDPTAGTIIPRSINIISVLNAGFNAQLNLMEQEGDATVLARPTLSTRSGSKANFLAGGEVPYSVTSFAGTQILFKKYGIELEVKPTVDRNGVIRAEIMSKVSEIDPALSVPGGPALLTRETSSEFNVKSGETIVLSGLLQRNKGTTVDKLPFLGDIPILGALFKSKRYQDKKTELVVFVTPTATDRHTTEQQEDMEAADKRVEKNVDSKEGDDEKEKSGSKLETEVDATQDVVISPIEAVNLSEISTQRHPLTNETIVAE